MRDPLQVIGALHLHGFTVTNPATNAAGDVMFDIELRGDRGE